ncbi:MAG: uracil-DNA glycosylase family protein [Bacteroidales bacterium]|nr:uracil-DNA glycosylase family protein [Bacteroidales bacterium]MDD3859296.1 uracil-DNA glycosylase family protein [Bacteroidales bacterium]
MNTPPFDFANHRVCKACGLFLNQIPVYDDEKKSSVFWVGLSSVLISADEAMQPLSPNTRTGSLIKKIEDTFVEDVSFYKTNIVKCVPLQDEKIRYPKRHEMEKCYPNFVDEITRLKPKVVFLLGKQVASFVLNKFAIRTYSLSESFDYCTYKSQGFTFVPVHHPSYILVYKRKFIDLYVKNINVAITESIVSKEHCKEPIKAE